MQRPSPTKHFLFFHCLLDRGHFILGEPGGFRFYFERAATSGVFKEAEAGDFGRGEGED